MWEEIQLAKNISIQGLSTNKGHQYKSNETVILSADEKYRFPCNWHSNGLSRWKIEAGVTMISRWWRAIEII